MGMVSCGARFKKSSSRASVAFIVHSHFMQIEEWLSFCAVGGRVAGAATGGRGESRLVGGTSALDLSHCVVDLQDGFLGAVGAVSGYVFAFYYGEGFHDVVDVVAGDVVEVEVQGV